MKLSKIVSVFAWCMSVSLSAGAESLVPDDGTHAVVADPAAEAAKMLEDYLVAIAKVKDITYDLYKTERMRDGDVIKEGLAVKVRVKPYAVYVRGIDLQEGMEVLYRAGWNDGDSRAHPGSFPDLTLNLSPEGSLAMKNQHFPVYATGHKHLQSRVKQALALTAKGKVTIKKIADQNVDGKNRPCVEVDASKLGGRKVKAKDDETLFALGKRTKSTAYLIYMNNPAVDDIDDELDEGQQVFIPTYNGVRAQYCFNESTQVIIRESYFDKKGLWERYDATKRKLNPGLTAKDFDPKNSSYDF